MNITTKNEIVLYQIDKQSQHINVRVEGDNVWLNRQQLSTLFDRDVKTIGKHIANILKEELKNFSVVAKFATTAKDGKVYQVEYYNLDMIISVGYRVKSHRGIQFRIWANKVLKDHLLKGYSVNRRINRIENDVVILMEKVDQIDLQINANLPPNQGIFFNGQIFDAYTLIADIIRSAKKSIVLIDNYIDDTVFMQLAKRKKGVKTVVYTKNITKVIKQDLQKYNAQYPNIELKKLTTAHDRFLIIDEKVVYHFGASLKDAGRKWFAFSKLAIDAMDIINKL